MPRAREISDHYKPLRSEAGDNHPHPSSQVVRHGVQRLHCARVTLIRQAQQVRKTQALFVRAGLMVIPQSGAVRGEYFPTSPAAAGTQLTSQTEANETA